MQAIWSFMRFLSLLLAGAAWSHSCLSCCSLESVEDLDLVRPGTRKAVDEFEQTLKSQSWPINTFDRPSTQSGRVVSRSKYWARVKRFLRSRGGSKCNFGLDRFWGTGIGAGRSAEGNEVCCRRIGIEVGGYGGRREWRKPGSADAGVHANMGAGHCGHLLRHHLHCCGATPLFPWSCTLRYLSFGFLDYVTLSGLLVCGFDSTVVATTFTVNKCLRRCGATAHVSIETGNLNPHSCDRFGISASK